MLTLTWTWHNFLKIYQYFNTIFSATITVREQKEGKKGMYYLFGKLVDVCTRCSFRCFPLQVFPSHFLLFFTTIIFIFYRAFLCGVHFIGGLKWNQPAQLKVLFLLLRLAFIYFYQNFIQMMQNIRIGHQSEFHSPTNLIMKGKRMEDGGWRTFLFFHL